MDFLSVAVVNCKSGRKCTAAATGDPMDRNTSRRDQAFAGGSRSRARSWL
jgi:hypothetical protein